MFDGVPIADLTAPTLLGVGILFLMLGRLVPLNFYKEKASEADKWKEAYEKEREARIAAADQSKELLEIAKTTHDILSAMFGTGRTRRRSGETDVVP
jgi:hypothetical protein